MDVVSAVVRCAEGFGKPDQLSAILIFFQFFQPRRVVLLVRRLAPQGMCVSFRPDMLKYPQCIILAPNV